VSKSNSPQRVNFLGLGFDQVDRRTAIELIERLSRGDSFGYVVTPNVDHVVRLHSDLPNSKLWASYRAASLCICDSRVLYLLGRISGINLGILPGSDLTAHLLNDHLREFPRVAVIGGDLALIDELQRRYGSCEWHHHMPPMGLRDDSAAQRAIVDFVRESDADLFLFAIGSPQSELLCFELAGSEARGVGLCIGASLEFLSGAKKRAPVWLQRLSLEWFFRLVTEPRRLWRRYIMQGPTIFRIWGQWNLRGARRREESDSR